MRMVWTRIEPRFDQIVLYSDWQKCKPRSSLNSRKMVQTGGGNIRNQIFNRAKYLTAVQFSNTAKFPSGTWVYWNNLTEFDRNTFPLASYAKLNSIKTKIIRKIGHVTKPIFWKENKNLKLKIGPYVEVWLLIRFSL